MENQPKQQAYNGVIQCIFRLMHFPRKNMNYLSHLLFSPVLGINKTRFNKHDYIQYKIIDVCNKTDVLYYTIECSYTKSIQHLTIQDIVFDLNILHALPPSEGCFIGIEYAKILKEFPGHSKNQRKNSDKINTYPICRYGCHNLLYQDRNGDVGFECRKKDEQFLMDPRDIALSRELIEEFDVAQAFFIGLWAGLKSDNLIQGNRANKRNMRSLRLVDSYIGIK